MVRYVIPKEPSHLLRRQLLLHLAAHKRVIQRRKRIKIRSLLRILLSFRRISLCLIRLAQTIQIPRILQVRLLQLSNRLVVILLSERDPIHELMSLPELTRILLRLSALTKFPGVLFRGREILSRNRERRSTEEMLELLVVFDLLR